MMQNKTTFQFISEPSDVNYGGNVHGGSVMKWIDQAGYACASSWSSSYCVTVYVGGIRFYSPIKIGHIVKVEAQVIYTGRTSMHIAINVFSRNIKRKEFEKKRTALLYLSRWMTKAIPWKSRNLFQQRSRISKWNNMP
ncbi:hypothetical protein L0B70_09280 [Kaistella sp. 97-N-M2]|uniref:acyl-CoA thioesterase n=1 Tax=Kaistella sp. 97-N-M2 TaxID=2908645 RepID=UPI001F359A9A|nr:hotdog domain-containing protein [Kaistella sp. 97-N-M2]UJF29037.1 hypothetical protein L0B70_09280 [Kaistella sp. 97-N-M2]